MICNYFLRSGLALSAPVIMLGAGSAVQAHSDIFFEYQGGKIVVESDHFDNVFEGEFSSPFYYTGNPGFNTGSPINPTEFLGYNVVGPLVYHDGTDFASTSSSLSVTSFGGSPIVIDESTAFESGLVGQAGGSGAFHAHIGFTLLTDDDSARPVGAYGILLELFTANSDLSENGIANSDPFWIVFNLGLDDGTFHSVLHTFEHYGHDHGHGDDDDDDDHGHGHVVPTPSAAMLAGIGGIGMLLRRGRRSDA